MNAKEVAISLAHHFLAEGRYASMPSPVAGAIPAGVQPASARDVFLMGEDGFEGLSIQSVGYEEGNDANVVHVYVTRGSASALKKISVAQGDINILATKMGEVRVRPEMAAASAMHGNLFVYRNRLACGSSCAPSGETYSGTLGALVRDSAGQLFVLSNNHVLAACNHIPVGMPILAPSSSDARPNKPAPAEIGRHHQIVELRSGEPTLVPCAEVDAAIALVTNPDKITSWQGDENHGYDTPSQAAQPLSGLRVKKFGRTTGLTLGTVEALIPTSTPLPYKMKNFSAVVWFQNIWTILGEGKPFALPGDSGSLVVTEDGTKTVGLIFAASPSNNYGWMIPINEVLSKLGGLSLVSHHGVQA